MNKTRSELLKELKDIIGFLQCKHGTALSDAKALSATANHLVWLYTSGRFEHVEDSPNYKKKGENNGTD